ncbi:hypothetical protein HU200_039928 [Digitaria exilis]|uniref:MATH domain-containing protein n=1 Tax=Digitaria exilis TaxID=1010633 RepID=A0A835B9K2_9POAL|nr:hypothetical protein HU200_039928 [Digitaria exilis]
MATKTQVKSSSTCHPPETTQGARIFDILGYSKHRGMGPTAFIRSAVFNVAGYNWVIFFYPDGFTDESAGGGFDFVSAYLRLLTTNRGKVRASCDLRLVNPTTSKATSVHPTLVTTMREYDPDGDKNKVFNCMCIGRAQLEGTYVKNDRLTMECVVSRKHRQHIAVTSFSNWFSSEPFQLQEKQEHILGTRSELKTRAFHVDGEEFVAHTESSSLRGRRCSKWSFMGR